MAGKRCGANIVVMSVRIQGLFNALRLGIPSMMKSTIGLFVACGIAVGATSLCLPAHVAHADAPGRNEQGEVRRERRAGNVLSLREIEHEVLPRIRGMQYIGPEYDSQSMTYRLKFIRDGKIYYMDVDARSGRIIGQSQ